MDLNIVGVQSTTELENQRTLEDGAERAKFTTKIFQNIPKYSKIFQNIPKYSKLFQNIPKYSKIFQNIPK